jgi:hypothetical protein
MGSVAWFLTRRKSISVSLLVQFGFQVQVQVNTISFFIPQPIADYFQDSGFPHLSASQEYQDIRGK